mmetsp:Transcript_75137/g.242945  ORF Transcript_75137/g.242945 Transcript_75137/m.242945 type:complete len:87 (-) Transcript_75137:108-368(-)
MCDDHASSGIRCGRPSIGNTSGCSNARGYCKPCVDLCCRHEHGVCSGNIGHSGFAGSGSQYARNCLIRMHCCGAQSSGSRVQHSTS